MNLEQKKLFRQLLELGDIIYFKRNKETIVKAISLMDSKSLEYILDRNIIYQDATKEVFLGKLDELFISLKKTDDFLLTREGKCNSDKFSNKNKCGVIFLGNKTYNHFPLIFDEDSDNNVTDIYYCNDFKCDNSFEISKNSKSLHFKIFDDEKANFIPTIRYNYININSLNAIEELKKYENSNISLSNLIDWINKHTAFYKTLFMFHLNFKNEELFYNTFTIGNRLIDFASKEDDCQKAVRLFQQISLDNDLNILKWLIEFDELRQELCLFSYFFLKEKQNSSDYIEFDEKLKISIKVEYFRYNILFGKIIDEYLPGMLAKYKSLNPITQKSLEDFDKSRLLRNGLKKKGIDLDRHHYTYNIEKTNNINRN